MWIPEQWDMDWLDITRDDFNFVVYTWHFLDEQYLSMNNDSGDSTLVLRDQKLLRNEWYDLKCENCINSIENHWSWNLAKIKMSKFCKPN